MSSPFFNALKGKSVLYLLLATISLQLLILLYTIPKTSAFAGGLSLLDVKPLGYNTDYVMFLFEQLGNDGRSYYKNMQLAIDLVYPMFFMISFTALSIFTTAKLKTSITLFKPLYWLPLVAGLSNYIENLFIHYMLNNYPKIAPLTVQLSSVTSVIKHSSSCLYIVLIMAAGIMVFSQQYFSSKKTLKA